MNANDALISIIVPIYNAEQYLRRCLDSIRLQTHQNIEVLLIDDGSTDSSKTICEEYLETDSRFKLISQENCGSSAARNTGLSKASGDYVAFVDADDSVLPEFLSKLLDNLIEYDADISLCDILLDGKKREHTWNFGVFKDDEIFSEYVHGRVINRVYNKLYKRAIVCEIAFPVGRDVMEDASWTPRVLERCHVLVRSSEALYNYFILGTSLSHKRLSDSQRLKANLNEIDRQAIILNNVQDEDTKKNAYIQTAECFLTMIDSAVDLGKLGVYDKMRGVVLHHAEDFKKYALDYPPVRKNYTK